MVLYALVWSGKRGGRHVLRAGKEYFVGRAKGEDLDALPPSIDGLDVLIFSRDYSEYSVTGSKESYVSRRHALLYYRDGILYVRDHGPEGKRSKYGTFVNGEMIPMGGERRLAVGDVLRLAPNGPSFMIGVEERGEAVVPIYSGVPSVVPVEVARRLEMATEVRVLGSAGSDNVKIVVEGAKNDIRVPAGGGGVVLVVGGEGASGRRDLLSTAYWLRSRIDTILELVARREEFEAEEEFRAIQAMLDSYSSIIVRLPGGERIVEELRGVVTHFEQLGSIDDSVKRRLRLCRKLLDDAVRSL